MIKKLFLVLSILFIFFTFAGAGYVLLHDGTVSAGYACVPMVFALTFFLFIANTDNACTRDTIRWIQRKSISSARGV